MLMVSRSMLNDPQFERFDPDVTLRAPHRMFNVHAASFRPKLI
jgi:hypothetical protein